MKCFMTVEKGSELLDGKFDFFDKSPVLYETVDKILHDDLYNPKEHVIVQIEFMDQNEIREAIMCSYMGNSKRKFTIRVIKTIFVS